MSTRADVGETIPDMEMDGPDGARVKPSDFRGRKLVMFFYPKDDTPGCTTENKDFSELAPQFAEADVAVLGISKDPQAKHAKFIAKHDLTVPLLSDAEENGLAEALGIWVQKNMYGRTYMGMERTTYLVDEQGAIARVWRKVKVKGHAAEVLQAAREL